MAERYIYDIPTSDDIGWADLSIRRVAAGQVGIFNGSTSGSINVGFIAGLNLNSISDVTISTPSSGQVLKYNGSEWVNDSVAGGSSALNDLTDVVISSSISGHMLRYDGSNWINTHVGIQNLSGVAINTATSGNLLRFDGSGWVNQNISINSLSNVATNPISGDFLIFNGSIWQAFDPNINFLSGVSANFVSGSVLKYNGYTWTDGECIKVLETDVANADNTANTLYDISGLSFNLVSGGRYRFYAYIQYSSAATTTGSRWTINGPSTSFLNYRSQYTITSTTITSNTSQGSYQRPTTSNTGSVTAGNFAEIAGILQTSATGTLIVQFASEISGSAITALSGSYMKLERY